MSAMTLNIYSLITVTGLCLSLCASDEVTAQTAPADLPIEIVPSVGGGWSPSVPTNGKFLALAAGTGVEIWDLEKARLLRRIGGMDGLPRSAVASPDGRHVAATTETMTKIWDVVSGQEVAGFTPPKSPFAMSYSADGGSLIYACHGSDTGAVVKLEIRSGRSTSLASKESFYSLAVSRDGKAFAAGGEKTIRIFSAEGRVMRTLKMPDEASRETVSMAFSPDGARLVSASMGSTVRVWSTSGGNALATLLANEKFLGDTKVDWSLDGKTIASTQGSLKGISFWNAQTGVLEREIKGAMGSVNYLPDGKSMLAGMRRLDLKSYETISEYGRSVSSVMVPAAADGKEVFIAKDAENSDIQIFDIAIGIPRSAFKLPSLLYAGMSASNDGQKVGGIFGKPIGGFRYENYPAFIDRDGGDLQLFPIKLGSDLGLPSALSPDGQILAVGDGRSVLLIETKSGRVVRALNLKGEKNAPQSLSFSRDGKALVAGDWEGVRIWQVETGAPSRLFALEGHGSILAARFSADGHSVFAGGWGLDQWSTGGKARTFKQPKVDTANLTAAIDIHPNGQLILTSTIGGRVDLWSTSGQINRTLLHKQPVKHAAFRQQGARVVTGAADGVKVWNTDTGELLASHLADGDAWVTITPEGFFDASDKGTQLLTVVRGLEATSIDQVYQTMYRPDLVREKLAGDPRGLVREAAAKLDLTKVMASGAAPKVAIVSPSGSAASPSDELTAEASITDNGGGVGKIEWRVNGLTLGIEERGLGRVDGAPAQSAALRVTRKLSLEPGDNVIEVVAYNGRNLIASEPARVTVKWDGANPATPPKLHVLAIGVNDYWDSRIRLSYAVPDARAIAQSLAKAAGGLYQSVETTLVLDADVTAANLEKVFTEVGRKVQPRDVFVFFLAGHGKTVDGKYYFLPQDFRYENEQSIVSRGIGQDRFQSWFAKVAARKSILLYDTCESGSLTGDRVAQRGIERVAALEKMTRAMGRTVLSASTEDAPALEGYRGHGVFTYALLDGLNAADTNGNGLIEVTELAGYIDQKVPDLSYEAFKLRQIPQMKIVGSNFPLTSKFAALSGAPAQAAPSGAVIPTRPTHVVIMPTTVRQTAAATGAAVSELPAGSQVTLMQTEGQWVIVARDGKRIGYVEGKSLVRLQ
jgi:WD40 repeat protein/uncharacterized caspase-like protein